MPIPKTKEEIKEIDRKRKEMEAQYNPLSDLYKFELNKEELYHLSNDQLEEIKNSAIKEKRYELARIVKLEQRKRKMNLENLSNNEIEELEKQAIADEDFDLVLLIEDIMFGKIMKRENLRREFFNQEAEKSGKEIGKLVKKLNE